MKDKACSGFQHNARVEITRQSKHMVTVLVWCKRCEKIMYKRTMIEEAKSTIEKPDALTA